ncbi:MAG: hypothetical protein IPI04_05815 [Ignavibacteria bacterium]|nr:hypothetical protein [Ignavibacteria bacterium]
MKTKDIFTTTGYIIMMLVFSVFSSCTKTADNVQTKRIRMRKQLQLTKKIFQNQ